MIPLVDTHCHLDFTKYDPDRSMVIQRAMEAGVKKIVNPGINIKTSQEALQLSERYDSVYASVGVHPNDLPTSGSPDGIIERLRELAAHPKVVAIGEFGLDYHWDKHPRSEQHMWMRAQLKLAADLELPVILHNRKSTGDIRKILSEWVESDLPAAMRDRPGVLHSFSGDRDDAEAFVEMGFFLGFTGPITYKNADEMRYVARLVPEHRMLIETDGPFLTPHPLRGRRNEPAYLQHIVDKIAEVRGETPKRIAEQTTHNAAVLFGWCK